MLPVPVTMVSDPNNMVILDRQELLYTRLYSKKTKGLITRLQRTGMVRQRTFSWVNSVWCVHLCLCSGTLTQFLLVLYGTDSASCSSSEKSQPGGGSCKTLDLRQICIGKTSDVNILLRGTRNEA